jgi:hypothetical protein
MKFGEPIVVLYPGTKKAAVTITLNSIQANLQCTQQFAPSPTNGQFLGLSFTAVTDADYKKLTGGQDLNFFGNDFLTATSPTGRLTRVNGSSCVDGEFPFDVPAGDTTKGIVVLDVSLGVTNLVWDQSTLNVDVTKREWTLR